MRLLIVAIAIVGLASSALGQVPETLTPEAYVARVGRGALVVPADELTIDGRPVACRRSPAVFDPNLADYAVSFPGFIVLRPDVIATVTKPVALWIYHHECGHLHGIKDESEADCFAVARGRREKWLTPQALEEVCAFISKGRASAEHLSGPERCAKMRQCYKEPSARVAAPGAAR
jgi:hypothetical protein